MSHAYWVKVADEGYPLGLYKMEVPGGWLYLHVMRVPVKTWWGEYYQHTSALVFVPLPSESRGNFARRTREIEWNMSDEEWDKYEERTR